MQSFVIGILAIAAGFFYGGIPATTVFFYGSIVCMQLIEYIIWTYGAHPTVNFYTSVSAVLLLGIQPVASLLTFIKTPLVPVLSYLALLGVYFIVHVSFTTKAQLLQQYHMHETSHGHLAWNWLQPSLLTTVGLIIYFVFLLGPIVISRHWELLGIVLCTLILSLYSYYKYNTWGSMWCWIVLLLVVVSSVRMVVRAWY